MPTYVYRCAACDHGFEQYQAFTDDALTDCPACGEARLRKVFNSVGVTFNGSGFYRTDSRSEGKSESSSKHSSGESGSGGGSGSGSASGSGAKSSDAAGSKSSTPAGSTAAAS